MTPAAVTAHADDFTRESQAAIGRLRAALAAVTSAIPGAGDLRRAADLQRALKLRTTLAWQVHRFATAEDPMEEVESIPGRTALRLFVDAAQRRGVTDERIAALTEAIESFEELVRTHAGTRKTFNSMVMGGRQSDGPAADLTHRRAAFHANSHILGTQLAARLGCFLVHPCDAVRAHVATINGAIGLRRLHGRTPYVLVRGSHRYVAPDSPRDDGLNREPHASPLRTAKDQSVRGRSLLRDFCSDPEFTVRDGVDGYGNLITELVPPDLGRQGTVTGIVADIYPGSAPRYRVDEPEKIGSSGYLTSPSEVMISDFLIADGVHGPTLPTPRAFVLRNFDGGRRPEDDEVGEPSPNDILLRPSVVYLGRGSAAATSPDVPRYPEMLAEVCRQLDWDPECFHVFRCRVEYPIVPSLMFVEYDLPRESS